MGQLLNDDVLEQALRIDWQRQAVRRQRAAASAGVALGSVPLVERLRTKSLDGGEQAARCSPPIRRPGSDGRRVLAGL